MQAPDMEAIARRPKELLQALNRLSELGLQNHEVPLPNIVVLGDQSAGKSSVIEAISDITVPRSSGTCTRCPLLIKSLGDNEPGAVWRCKIDLHRNYEFYPQGIFDSTDEDSPFKPWIANATPVVIPFLMIDSKDKLREGIHRAQLALLNPGQPTAKYASGRVQDIGNTDGLQCEFTPNVVSVEISGPGRINLSFYDLPGIINQTEDEDKPWLVDIVRNLAAEYIKSPNTIVLLAKSMEGDPHNSSAARLAKEVGAHERCVGVLTKPDRIPLGDPVDMWRKMLCGDQKTFYLPLGYYVTKQPSQADLDGGIDNVRARQIETMFFSTKEPWATKFAEFKDRFGTFNLQKALSDQLAERMVKNLPKIRESIRTQIDELDLELENIPEPPTQNALGAVLSLLQSYSNQVTKLMEGEHPFNEWRLTWKAQRESFLRNLTAMRPSLHIQGDLDTGLFPNQIDLTGDSEDDHQSPTPEKIASTPSLKRRRVDEPSTPRQMPMAQPSSVSRQQAPKTPTRKKSQALPNVFYLDRICKVLNDISSSDIPREIDSKALDFLILESLKDWDKPMATFFRSLEQALRSQMQGIFDQIFGPWKTSELYGKAWEIVDQLLTSHMSEQRDTLAVHALRVEREKPFAGDDKLWDHHILEALGVLQDARISRRLIIYVKEKNAITGKETKQSELAGLKAKPEVSKIIRDDPYRREVEVMSKVRGYYKISSVRFYSNICLNLQAKLFKFLRESLHEELTTGLGVFADDGKSPRLVLLEEDPERAERRRTLLNKRQALVEGRKCLAELLDKYKGAASGDTDAMDIC
ncbi:P-loop containing nucleoside triphosphate hydrolase protein [Mytilinidion resinicola]|uniref:P-loop containing nucleoside triphosphate hydrolase protein n=1 Tax=Mytilinidion resinicola TaxID=574789 RepID=A0A6A6Y077_9PEZI|nr:P-loop containing nucleoside triphosphate hydrolase protein [Mytilinidion resinicola]KAF2802226.1 P-loop containing nucleoside triphosphate hydrolase protein [Mytilinidion resinicola]